jgi:peroxiredoxin
MALRDILTLNRWGSVALAMGVAAAVAVPVYAQIAVRNQGYIPYSDAPIFYRSQELTDPVARLQKEIASGKVSLTYDKDHGYLKSVLALLKVPVESQTLVFSKTSFQYPKISPDHPRALYYNDDVYVGAVHHQNGSDVEAALLRIDGDTGSYSGRFKDGKWVLGHFDGGRPGVITVTPAADGTIKIEQQVARPNITQVSYTSEAKATTPAGNAYAADATPDGRYAQVLTAWRQDVAVAKGLPAPEDFLTHTTARDPNEKFVFNLPDLDGKPVSSDDPRFKNKVVLAIVTGTWCPNCHDEAQYLVKLDRKYRDKGLSIVALTFEEPEQQGSFTRARAFIRKYGVRYTYLNAGAPAQMWEKVPQLNHLDTWPATLFIGRDGKIDAVHSGFASPASGEFHTQLEQEFTNRIERLLAQKVTASAAQPTKLAASR